MANVLAYTIPTPGHLVPFVPILIELQRRNHRVVLGLLTDLKEPVSLAGLRVRMVRWSPGDHARRPGLPLPQDAWSLQLRSFVAYGESLVASLERLIRAECPDFILVDPMLWGGLLTAEASGVAWASVAHNPLLFRALGLDVRGPGLPPPRGMLGRLRHRVVDAGLRAAGERLLPTMNAVRQSRGLSPLACLADMYQTPPLTIVTTAEPFEYPRSDWPQSLRFVGPMVWDPPAEVPAWIREVDERPLVLLVGSSIQEKADARSWVNLAMEALADEPFQVIATLPTDDLPNRLPSNVRVKRMIPHGHVLSRAVCVVCHGGPGITQKALAAGVPVVAVPFAYDRFEVARRVEVAGAGVMLPGKRLTPTRLKAAVREAINCKAGAQRIAEAFRSAGGAGAAADAVEGVLCHGRGFVSRCTNGLGD